MSARFHVDANLISTPFSGAANTFAARNEERRLERIYGGPPRPREDPLDRMMRVSQQYRQDLANEASSRAIFGTSQSNAHVIFQKKTYTLSPEPVESYTPIHDHGNVDNHFGGLGYSRKMADWFDVTTRHLGTHFNDVRDYNKAVEKKSKGLFKKKSSAVPLMQQLPMNTLFLVFNRRLAEARVAARMESWNGDLMLIHPSSTSGDLHAEMQKWADAHWTGVPERPWHDTLLELPAIPSLR